MPEQQSTDSVKWNISLAQLTLAVVYVLLGGALAELIRNISGAETISFSTTELVGFVLSVVLSAASIVLAIAAIWLGKISELSMIRRSDESIKLQNEVYVRTTEALKRIESSTGVTEKRIEDIISGRVGDISHKIAELTAKGAGLSADRETIETEIKRIIEGTKSRNDEEETRRRAKILAQQERYKQYHQSVLTAFANQPGFVAKKLGDGSFDGEGDELFDVVGEIAGKTIAASAFSLKNINIRLSDYLPRVSKALQESVADYVFIAVDTAQDKALGIQQKAAQVLSVFKGDPEKKVQILCAEGDEIEAAIQSVIQTTKGGSQTP